MLIDLTTQCHLYLTIINYRTNKQYTHITEIYNVNLHVTHKRFMGSVLIQKTPYYRDKKHGLAIKCGVDGKSKSSYTYYYNVVHGPYTSLTANSSAKGQYKLGRLHGLITHTKLETRTVSNYVEGVLHGLKKCYIYGKLAYTEEFAYGNRHGKTTIYNSSSTTTIIYNNCRKCEETEVDMNNVLLRHIVYIGSVTIETKFNPSVKTINYTDGRHEKITAKSHEYYHGGRLNGVSLYFKRGKLYKSVTYKNDKKDGPTDFYDQDGNVIKNIIHHVK